MLLVVLDLFETELPLKGRAISGISTLDPLGEDSSYDSLAYFLAVFKALLLGDFLGLGEEYLLVMVLLPIDYVSDLSSS